MSSATTVFQRTKRTYIAEEEKLESIVTDSGIIQIFQQWLNTSISQLDSQYERCEQQLAELQQRVSVQGGNFWGTKTIIDHCNLHMSEKRLVPKNYRARLAQLQQRQARDQGQGGEGAEGGDAEAEPADVEDAEEEGAAGDDRHAPLPDVIRLISCLQQTKSQSFVTPKQRQFIAQCMESLKTATFEPRELVFIINALETKLKDGGNTRGVFGDLTSFQQAIEQLSPDIDQCEQLLEASIANGEMGLAEDISRRQLDIYEHMLRLITDQYPVIANYYSESRSGDRRRRWAVFCMADRDITAVVEGKYRQMEACEEDLLKIREQMTNYCADDEQQKKRYLLDRSESDRFLQQNKEKQQGVWNRLFELFQELQKCQGELGSLAAERRREVERRLQLEEREAGRRSGHEAFLHAATEHAQRLQDTIQNAQACRELAEALNNFVLDGCDSITAKYDKQQNALSDMLRLVQGYHFKRFSDYYIVASRFLYRKERRLESLDEEIRQNDMRREMLTDTLDPIAKGYAETNADLAFKRRQVAEEVQALLHKREKAEKAIALTLRSFDYAGVAYVHPREMVEKMNLNRWSTMLDYREVVQPPTAQKMNAQLEEEAAEIDSLRQTMESTRKRPLLGAATMTAGAASFANGAPLPTAGSAGAAMATRRTVLGAKGPSALEKGVQAMLSKPLGAAGVAGTYTAGVTSASTGAAAAHGSSGGGRTGVAATMPTAASPASAAAPVAAAAAAGAGPTRMEGSTFRALFAYKARAPDELSFEVNDRIVCVSRAQEEGWFKGICNQRTGLFPINYVEPDPEDP